MILQYAGMKTVPPNLYEAAAVDGAGPLQKFRHVTLPSLRGILLINLVLITIATLNTFDMVLPLTGGGPGRATEVVALYVYHLVFSEFQLGRGAAVAVFLMAVGLVLSACYARIMRREPAA
jgi:multiple sugar transport system permease protein